MHFLGLALILLAGADGDVKFVPPSPVAVAKQNDAKPFALGVWNHSGLGAYPGDWIESAKLLHDNGFTMIFPNMLWAGSALYPSELIPRSSVYRQYGDQIDACCAAAQTYGLKVHVWKVNFNLATAHGQFLDEMTRAHRTQVDVKGKPVDWLCPSHPENQKLETETMLEVLRKYPVDGLHFDYIRYPNSKSCFCDGCRERFEAASGKKVENWPTDCFSGPRKREYNDWRCDQITKLVATVHAEAKKLKPSVKISAAVYGDYPDCREGVAQDWAKWVREGYLDFICPMDYTDDDAYFASLVKKQRKLVGDRTTLYVGVGATAWEKKKMPIEQALRQIQTAKDLGADGAVIFEFKKKSGETLVPRIGEKAFVK